MLSPSQLRHNIDLSIYHLLQAWFDRFVGQHSALAYYLITLIMWVVSPTLAYNFSELIEAHAVDTYAEFMDANEAALRDLPPPEIALAYYECGGERGGDDGICDVLDAPIGSPDDVSKPNPK